MHAEWEWDNYRKIPKISPGADIFQRPFLRGLSMEGNLCFKIDWASLMVERKFTIFALLCIWGQFPSTSPWGAYIWRGDLTEGFLGYEFGGLIFGGANTWRGLFLEFYGVLDNTFRSAWTWLCCWPNNISEFISSWPDLHLIIHLIFMKQPNLIPMLRGLRDRH